jgi:hypothetical protein
VEVKWKKDTGQGWCGGHDAEEGGEGEEKKEGRERRAIEIRGS